MMSFVSSRFTSLIFLSLLLFGCGGAQSKTAKVTLITGLENNHTTNLMDVIAHGLSPKDSGVPTCIQPQIYAGFSISTNQDNSNAITLTTVSLSTPTAVGGTVESIYGDVSAWLLASNLAPVSIDAPIEVPIDIAIVGALASAPAALSDGTCPIVNGTIPYASYSLIGHTQTTISGDTTLPINLWALNAGNPPAYNASQPACNQWNQNTMPSQVCPNLNFNQVTTGGNTIPTGEYVRFEYFFDQNNPLKRVVQTLPVNSGVATGFIPNLTHLLASIVGSNGVIATMIYDNADPSLAFPTPSPTPYFNDVNSHLPTGNFISVVENGAVTPPSNFNMNPITFIPGGFTLNWNPAQGAFVYSLGISATSGAGYDYTAYPSILPGALITAGLTSATNYLRIRAKPSSLATAPATLSSNEFTYRPLQPPTSVTPYSGGYNMTWTGLGGTDTYVIRYDLTSNVQAATQPYPSGYGVSVNSSSSTYHFPSGSLTATDSYTFVIECYDSSGNLISISAPFSITPT